MNRHTVIFRDGLVFFAIVVALFVGAVVREVNLLLFFASLLFSLVLFDRYMGKRALRHLDAKRTLPTVVYAGDSFLMTLRISNQRKKNPCWALVVEDRITPILQDTWDDDGKKNARELRSLSYRPVCYFDRVDPQSEQRHAYAGQLPLRGLYRLGPLSVSTRFPLGFFRSSVLYKETTELYVYPKLGKLTRSWFRQYNQISDQHEHRLRLRASRTSDEPMGIRRWQSGDAQKWIHWRATAKHRQIFVRQFQERQHQDVAIILDTWQPGALTQETFENLELAVSFVGTLVKEFTGSLSGSLYFISGSDHQVNGGKTGFVLFHNLMTRLAMIQRSKEDHLVDAFRILYRSIEHATNIILVTASPENPLGRNRLGSLRSEPIFSRLLGKIHMVDVSETPFDDLFQI